MAYIYWLIYFKVFNHNLQSLCFLQRPLINYGDIIYDQHHNESFCEKIESVQYKAALAITGAIQGTFLDKLYQELGFESLKNR